MSDRKKGGGLDYTPQAFPGARAPDGPAPDLADKLAKLGLVEGTEATGSRIEASPGVNVGTSRGAKKRAGLDYTPQAFPGARAPDGPAPDLHARLAQMGLVEQTAPADARADVRHDPIPASTPPRRTEPVAPPVAPQPAPAVRQAPPTASPPPAYSAPPAPVPAESSRRAATSSPPISPPVPSPPRHTERAVSQEPAPRSTERAPSPSATASPPPQRPVPVAPPPASAPAPSAATPPPRSPTATSTLPPVPKEAEPRPLPVAPPQRPVPVAPQPASAPAPSAAAPPPRSPTATSTLPPVPKEAEPQPLPVAPPAAALTVSRGPKAITKAASQALRRGEILRALPDKEDRVRISLRLVASVDQKLDDLAHLRGLDRNTAISVAISQDWIACFGLQARQEVR